MIESMARLPVEVDYASEFRYGGRALASLQGLDDSERVIYVGTLNKALFPGLRLGYAVVPPALLRAFITARYLVDSQPSSLCEGVVADFIEEGHFATHIRRMRLLYRDQRDDLVAALRLRLGDEMTPMQVKPRKADEQDPGLLRVGFDFEPVRGRCNHARRARSLPAGRLWLGLSLKDDFAPRIEFSIAHRRENRVLSWR